MQLSRIILNASIAVSLALMVSGCGGLASGDRIPPPDFDYAWSEPFKATMHDGEVKWVQCLTVNDKKGLDDYIDGMNMMEEVSQ